MADEVAKLGFDIDTKALEDASKAADKTAASIAKVGDATKKAGVEWGPPIDDLAASTAAAAAKAEEMAAKFEKFKQGLGTLKPPGPIMPPLPDPAPLEKIPENIKKAAKAAEDSRPGFLKLGEGLKGAVEAAREFAASYGVKGGVGAQSVTDSLTGTIDIVGKAAGMFGGLGATIAATAAIATASIASFVGLQAALATLVDKQNLMVARLDVAMQGTGSGAQMLAEIEERAIRAGRSVDATAQAFLRFQQSADRLTLTNSQLLDLVSTVQSLGTVSGLSGDEVNGVLGRMAQMFQQGTVNAQQLRSIMHTMPTLVNEIAAALGKTPGELREMAAAGQLAGDTLARAILSRQQQITEQARAMPTTVSGAFTRLTEEAERFFTRVGQLTGASEFMQFMLNRGASSMAGYSAMIAETPAFEQLQNNIARLEARLGQGQPAAVPNTAEEAARAATREAEAERIRQATRAATGGGSGSMFATQRRTAADEAAREQEREEQIRQQDLAQLEAYRGRLGVMLIDIREERERYADAQRRRIRDQPIEGALETAAQLDEFARKMNTLTTQAESLRKGIEAYQAQLREGEGGAAAQAALERLQRLYTGVGDAIRNLLPPLQAYNAETEKMIARSTQAGNLGGGRFGTEVRTLTERALTSTTGTGEGGAITDTDRQRVATESLDAVTRRFIETTSQELAVQQRASMQQRDLSIARSQGREAIISVTAEQRASNIIFERFGMTLENATPAVREFYDTLVLLYGQIERRNQDNITRDASRGITTTIEATRAQIAAIQQGEYAMRRAAEQVQANRDTTGTTGLRMQQFDVQEELKARQALVTLARQQKDAEDQIAAARADSPAMLVALQQELAIKRAIENVAPAEQAATRAQMEATFAAQRTANLEKQTSDLREQQTYAQNLLRISNLTGEELAVQTALLDLERRLRRDGVSLTSQQAVEQRRITEETVRTNERVREAQQRAKELEQIWVDFGQTLKSSVTEAMQTAFEEGTISGTKALEILGNAAQRMINSILQASVFSPLEAALKRFGPQALDWVINSISGGASASSSTPWITGNVTSTVQPVTIQHEGGMVGESGNVRYVPLSVFQGVRRYHNGGYIGGDEVPIIAQKGERVLTAGQQAGLGTTIIVNDMRGSEAPPVEQKDQGQGVDGKRLIELTVRDTTRKLLRSGELDRDMSANYGATRKLTRR